MGSKETNTGKELERQVANTYRKMGAWKVEHDVLMAGHQIDVYVEMLGPDRSLHRIAVEAKDWQGRVGIDVIGSWALVVDDLRRAGLVDEGIIVSPWGFTKPAREAVAQHILRGLPVRLLELADLEAMVAGAETAEYSRPSAHSSLPPATPSVSSDENVKIQRAENLDTRILIVIYSYHQRHPGDPKIDLKDLITASGVERDELLPCLLGLHEKAWLDYDLTEGAESGLVWLTRLGIRVAKAARRD